MHVSFQHLLEYFHCHLSLFLFIIIQILETLWRFAVYFLTAFASFRVNGRHKRLIILHTAEFLFDSLLFYNFFYIEERLWEFLRDWLLINVFLEAESKCFNGYLAEKVRELTFIPSIWSFCCGSRGLAVGTGCMMAEWGGSYQVWACSNGPWLTY